MPTFAPPPPNPSTTATAAASSASTPSDVSFTFDSIKQFAEGFLGRFKQSQKLIQDLLMDLSLQNKGKKPINDYSNFTPNPSLSAAPSENYQYGMPPNYFAGQTPLPGSVRSSRAEPVRPVPWCSVLRHSHKSRLFLLRLIIAWSKNWRILCRLILRSHTVNPRFLHRCPKMFGMIGLRPIHSMPSKRCPLLILRHIVLAKHLLATTRPIFLG